jgi:hypothetical protein
MTVCRIHFFLSVFGFVEPFVETYFVSYFDSSQPSQTCYSYRYLVDLHVISYRRFAYLLLAGRKSDDPASESFNPTLFPHSMSVLPRSTKTSEAAGYCPLPKTWLHEKARLNCGAHRPVQPNSDSSLTVIVCDTLKQCGHDYIQTTVDSISYNSDIVDAMNQLTQVQILCDSLSARLLTIENIKGDTKLFRFYTNLPNYEVFVALCEYLRQRAVTDGSRLFLK